MAMRQLCEAGVPASVPDINGGRQVSQAWVGRGLPLSHCRDSIRAQKLIKSLMKENESLRAQLVSMRSPRAGQVGKRFDTNRTVKLTAEQTAPLTLPPAVQDHPSIPFSDSPHEPTLEDTLMTVMRDEIHLASAAGANEGVLGTDHGKERYIGRGAGSFHVFDVENSLARASLLKLRTSRLRRTVLRRRADCSGRDCAVVPPELQLPLQRIRSAHCRGGATVTSLRGGCCTSSGCVLLAVMSTARASADTAVSRVEWMYRPTNRLAMSAAISDIYAFNDKSLNVRASDPHRLSTVLMAIALGKVFSDNPEPNHEQLFVWACGMLTLPDYHFLVCHSLASVETLHMMVSYLLAKGEPSAAKAAWITCGLAVRTAAALGLHRDTSRWGLSGQDKEIRERLWWECFTYDVLYGRRYPPTPAHILRQSLNFGRPYSMPTLFADCALPSPAAPVREGLSNSPTSEAWRREHDFHSFKYRLVIDCVHVANLLALPELPVYEEVMLLDGILRRTESSAPEWLQWRPIANSNSVPLGEAAIAQQHMSTLLVHKALLGESTSRRIHRLIL